MREVLIPLPEGDDFPECPCCQDDLPVRLRQWSAFGFYLDVYDTLGERKHYVLREVRGPYEWAYGGWSLRKLWENVRRFWRADTHRAPAGTWGQKWLKEDAK